MWPAVLMASTVLSSAGVALAQEPANQSTTLEEIIVTAQKREENLQKVPESVIALGSQKLDQLHVDNFNDYVKFLPSVTFTIGQPSGGGNGGPGFVTVSMRGVVSGNDGNHSGSAPTVGTYLDEQPITTIGGALDVHIYDVARVEALAGPQGTLYGASSEAGTVRIITNQPDPSGFHTGYNVEVNSVDHGGTGHVAEGFVNVPIGDKVAIRLVGWDEHDAGYIDNVHGTRTYPTSGITIDNALQAAKDYNHVDLHGGRAALKIDLNDNWTITPMIIGQSEVSHGFFGYDPQIGDLKVQHYNPEFVHDKWYQAALTIEGKIGGFDLVYSGGYMDRRIKAESDYSDYSFFYDTLFGSGSYFYDANGNLINPTQYILQKDHFTKQSHEFRVSTPKDERLRFIGGLFYQKQTHLIEQQYKINGLSPDISVNGLPEVLWLTEQMRTDTDYAIFGEGSFDVTSKLTITGGIRGFTAKNSLRGFFGFGDGFSSHTGVSQCFGGPTISIEPCTNLDKKVSESGVTGKANLTYHIDDDKLVYFTFSTGFRPGGINRRGTVPPYKSDYLTNYEAGWKTSWADNSIRWNGAVFFEQWKDFQFAVLGENSFTEIRNAGAADIKGVESDVTWRPIAGLTLNASGAYIDAKLTKDYCGVNDPVTHDPITDCSNPLVIGGAQAPSGTQLPITPKFKANATARYEFPLGPVDAHVQGALVYQGASWADLRIHAPDLYNNDRIVRASLGEQRSYATFDFSAGIAKDSWTLELAVLNAFDKRADLYRFGECTPQVCAAQPAVGSPGETYILPNQPRTIALRFGQKF